MSIAHTEDGHAAIDPWIDDKNVRRVARTLAEAFPDERACAIERPPGFDVTRAGHRVVARLCALGLLGFFGWAFWQAFV